MTSFDSGDCPSPTDFFWIGEGTESWAQIIVMYRPELRLALNAIADAENDFHQLFLDGEIDFINTYTIRTMLRQSILNECPGIRHIYLFWHPEGIPK